LVGDWEPEDEEHENLRAGLAWARESGDVNLELRFAGSTGLFYWASRGQLTEGRRWLDDALARSSQDADPRVRARALVAAGAHAWRSGDLDSADALAAEAAEVFERFDDRPLLAAALLQRGIAAEGRGDVAAEEAHYRAAERIFRELGHTDALTAILNNRGYADIVTGDFQSAERRLREVLETATGIPRRFAAASHGLALAHLGRLDEAETRFEWILQEAARTDRSPEILLYGFEGLALVAAGRAEDLRAAQLWGVTAGIREATGYALATAEQRFHDQLVPEVRDRAGETAFDRAWHVGRQLSFDEALSLALGGRR
jgi:non-specific serine/threonine protein kinase